MVEIEKVGSTTENEYFQWNKYFSSYQVLPMALSIWY